MNTAPQVSHLRGFFHTWLPGGMSRRSVHQPEHGLAVRLRMPEEAVVSARDELPHQDLVAYHPPLTQVLSLPVPRRVERGGGGALHGLKVPRV